jgi:23S rRNA pseudouridine2605 synthase
MDQTERLQRVMAARGIGSRRAAEDLIRAGRVSVDGQVISDLGTKVDPVVAQIRVDGRPLTPQRTRTILLNKPSGYITTTSDERGRRTVMDLVRVPERVYPVGRLDRDTQGLLILTNDGDVANRVMHPRYELDKEYHVLTPSRPSDRTLQKVRDGLTVEGRRIVPEEVRLLRETREGFVLKVVLHQGLYHVVRRMMEAAGVPVQRLRRVRIGPLSVTGIPVGEWRDLTPGEANQLYQALHLQRDEKEMVADDRRDQPHPVRRREARPNAARSGQRPPPTGDQPASEPRGPRRPAAPGEDSDDNQAVAEIRRRLSGQQTGTRGRDRRGRSAGASAPQDRRWDPPRGGPGPDRPSETDTLDRVNRTEQPDRGDPASRSRPPKRNNDEGNAPDARQRFDKRRGPRHGESGEGRGSRQSGDERGGPGRGRRRPRRSDRDAGPYDGPSPGGRAERHEQGERPPAGGGDRRRGGGGQDDRRPPPRRAPRRDAV